MKSVEERLDRIESELGIEKPAPPRPPRQMIQPGDPTDDLVHDEVFAGGISECERLGEITVEEWRERQLRRETERAEKARLEAEAAEKKALQARKEALIDEALASVRNAIFSTKRFKYYRGSDPSVAFVDLLRGLVWSGMPSGYVVRKGLGAEIAEAFGLEVATSTRIQKAIKEVYGS